MAIEEVTTETLTIEVSQNERTKDDKVYCYFEDWSGEGAIEVYLSVQDFKSILKAFLRLDEQLVV